MKAVLYYSKALVAVDDAVAWRIATVSAHYNSTHGITGYLCFYNGHFFQYIEGDAPAVSHTLARIATDRRHRIIKTHTEDRLTQLRFPHWRMRYLRAGDIPETALESAVATPLVDTSPHGASDWYWRSCLRHTLGSLSRLHAMGECVEQNTNYRLH